VAHKFYVPDALPVIHPTVSRTLKDTQINVRNKLEKLPPAEAGTQFSNPGGMQG